MRRAIEHLVQLSDERFLEEISKGIAHIVEYTDSLDSLAGRLVDIGEYHGTKTVHALAEEEAAKVFILVDAVRCPPSEQEHRARTLRGYYDHLAKHIYSEACWWRSADFAAVQQAIELEREPYYLDGPNDVDWIFYNSAKAERERLMYVDYVQDITKQHGKRYWVSPLTYPEPGRYYQSTPTSLVAAQALHRIGLTTPAGLSIVADVWRSFRPKPSTTFPELSRKMMETLKCVIERELTSEGDLNALVRTVINYWPFPLWSLDLRIANAPTVGDLRQHRSEYIEQLARIEAQRDPPPQIQRSKVEALSTAYDEWMLEYDQLVESQRGNEDGPLRILPDSASPLHLRSYVRLERMIRELTLEERMDLATLAWFGRQSRSGWERLHAHARSTICDDDVDYECGLGSYWLIGLERWESPPELPANLTATGEPT